jgi:hypothetical protein
MTNNYDTIIIGAGHNIGGLNSCLSSYNSVKTDSGIQPEGRLRAEQSAFAARFCPIEFDPLFGLTLQKVIAGS